MPSQTLFPVQPIFLPYGDACNPGGWETQHWPTHQEHRTSCQTLSSSASYRPRKAFRMFNLFTTGAFTNFISGSTHFPPLWYCLQSRGLGNTALANTPRAPDFVPHFVFLCQLPAPKSIQDVQFIHDRCLHKLYFRFDPFSSLMVLPAIGGMGNTAALANTPTTTDFVPDFVFLCQLPTPKSIQDVQFIHDRRLHKFYFRFSQFPHLMVMPAIRGLGNAALANTSRAPDFVPDFVFLCQLPTPKSIQDVQFIHDRCFHKLYFRFSQFPHLMVMPAIRGLGNTALTNTPRAPDFVPHFVFLCQLPTPKSIPDVQFIHDRCLHRLYFRFSPFPSIMVMPAIRGTGKYSSIDQHTDNNGLRARLCLPLPATGSEKHSGCSIYSRPVPSQTLFPVQPISLPYGDACNPGGLGSTALANTPRATDFVPHFVFLCLPPTPKSIQDVQFIHDRCLHKLYFRFDPFPYLMVLPAIRGAGKYSIG